MIERVTWMLWGGLVLALMLAGCVSSGVVVLTNPRTGQTVECREHPDGGLSQHARCIKAYEQSGYKITGDSR